MSVRRDRLAVHPEAFVHVLVNQLAWVHHREIPSERVSIETS